MGKIICEKGMVFGVKWQKIALFWMKMGFWTMEKPTQNNLR
jgi:hypothetical protein